ncbi:MAG: DUF2341 domain-containing protein [Verrucomicrobia bacterium]|nr:DUF2341 domain-containing protein [Verrucomicrobiota bacterium]
MNIMRGSAISQTRRVPHANVTVLAVVLAAAVLASECAEAAAPKPHTRSVTLSFSPDEVSILEKGIYQVVSLPMATYTTGQPGDPQLPSIQSRIVVPPHAEILAITHEATEVPLSDHCLLAPVQLPTPTDAPHVMTEPNAARYASYSLFPAENISWNGSTQHIGAHQTVSVGVTPIRYRAAAQQLFLATEITVTVQYQLPDSYALAKVSRARSRFDQHVSCLVANAEHLTESVIESVEQTKLSSVDSVDYLIITSETLRPAFSSLAEHRAAFNGFTCAIESIESIEAQYDGTRPDGGSDVQTQIRNCIRDYVDNRQCTYVVLGGDDSIVPDRDCSVSAGAYFEREMPTDSYYAGLDGTWDDADQDGVYGEHSVGGINEYDLAADVFVGRIPIRLPSQASDYIAKVVDYETSPPTDILRKFMMGGKRLWAGYGGTRRPDFPVADGHMAFRDAQHPLVSDVELLLRLAYRDNVQAYGWSASTVGCLFDTLTSWDEESEAGTYAASGENMTARFNEGWNFLFHDTHGNTDIWNGEDTSFGGQHAEALTGLTAFIYTIACHSGAFDKETSLGESFLRNAAGGALAYLGCSRYGWSGISPDFRNAFQEVLFRDRVAMLAPAFYAHKAQIESDYAYRRWVHFGLNLQGDPALRIQGLEPNVALTTSDAWAAEPGTDVATLTLTRTSTGGQLSVALDFTGSASSEDYVITPPPSDDGSFTFQGGETAITITIAPVDDTEEEPNETLSVSVRPSLDYADSGDDIDIVLVDNDGSALPTVSLTALDTAVSEADDGSAALLVTRSGADLPPVTIAYTVQGSATTSDYHGQFNGHVTLARDMVSATFALTPVDDPFPEGDETVQFTLTPSADYEIENASATVTIVDDEAPAVLSIVATTPTAQEGVAGENGAFTLSRTGDAGLPLEVHYALEVESTASDDDFNSAQFTGTVLIPSDAESATLSVEPVNDTLMEATETVRIRLSSGTIGAVVGDEAWAEVHIFDDDNVPPTLSVVVDSASTVECGDAIEITASPEDAEDAILRVELYCNDVIIASLDAPPYTVTWTAPTAGVYALGGRVWDSGNATATSETIALSVTPIPAGSGSGITYEWWTGVAGNDIDHLLAQTAYPDDPSGASVLTDAFESPANAMDNYGARASGYFVAPKNGNYRFSVSGDDRAELWLGTSGSAETRQRIAYINNPTAPREWDIYPSQTSAAVPLLAGQAYYIEAIHKESSGSDCLAVGVELPGGQLERPIPAHRLIPWQDTSSTILLSAPESLTVAEGGASHTYGIALAAEPEETVEIMLDAVTEQISLSANVLRFSSQNWWIEQQITIEAVDDSTCETDPHHVIISHQATGGGIAFESASAVVSVAIRDNDFELEKWPYRVRFDFDGYVGTSVLTSFPARIRLSSDIPGFDYTQFASQTGGDLRFVTSEGNSLSYEIESWDPSGESHIWVRIPELEPNHTSIWAYWGNTERTDSPAAAIDGSTWSSDYGAVWHLDGPADSTPHANTVTFNGVQHSADGIAGAAIGMDGEDAIRTADSFVWTGDSFTMSIWSTRAPDSDPTQTLMAYGSSSAGSRILMNMPNADTVSFGFPGRSLVTAPVTNIGWHQWTGVYDDAARTLSIYQDGNLLAAANASVSNLPLTEATLRIGEDFGDARFAGTLDEPRFSAATRSPDWIGAAHDTVAATEAFYSASPVVVAYPSLDTNTSVVALSAQGATLSGGLLSTGDTPTHVTCYYTAGDPDSSPSAWQQVPFGLSQQGSLHVVLTNLNFGTQYHYRFYAENTAGGVWGESIETFTTPLDPPRLDTRMVTDIDIDACTLSGEVVYLGLGGALPIVTVFWGTSDEGTQPSQWAHSRVLGTADVGTFLTRATSLSPGTRYYYRAYIAGASGQQWSPTTQAFETLDEPPQIEELGVASVTEHTASLSAMLPDTGGNNPRVTLLWGRSAGDANVASWENAVDLGTRSPGETLSATLSGLNPDTEYAYRWCAANAGGDAWTQTNTAVVTRFDRTRMTSHMRVTFPGYTRSTPLTNFPVPIALDETIPGFTYAGFASPLGRDIRFLNPDDGQPLQFEIESWNTSGTSIIWVKLPQLTEDTSVDVYWGDALQRTEHHYTSDGSVWCDEFQGVWHLNTTTGTPLILDSSPKGRHTEAQRPTGSDGQIALAEEFAGNGDDTLCLTEAPCNELLPEPNTPITASCWFNARTIESAAMSGTLIHLSADDGWCPILLSVGSGNQLQLLHSGKNAGGGLGFMVYDIPAHTGTWHHAAVVYDGSRFRLYLNGTEVTSQGGALDPGKATGAWLGSQGGISSPFKGSIDEVRFSSTARSATWLWAAAKSQTQGTDFTAYGPVELSEPDGDGDGIVDSLDPDDDNDGMPDAWEYEHGLQVSVAGDAFLDADGDGMQNLDEYIAGTDPIRRDSRLTLSAHRDVSGCALRFDTTTGRVYRVESSSSLQNTVWTTLESEITGTGEAYTLADTSDAPTRFYRIAVTLAP